MRPAGNEFPAYSHVRPFAEGHDFLLADSILRLYRNDKRISNRRGVNWKISIPRRENPSFPMYTFLCTNRECTTFRNDYHLRIIVHNDPNKRLNRLREKQGKTTCFQGYGEKILKKKKKSLCRFIEAENRWLFATETKE